MIRKILLGILLIIMFKIASCVYIKPYQWKLAYVNRYNKELNIMMNVRNIKITRHYDTGGNTGYDIEWIRTKKFENDIVKPEEYDTWYENEIPLNIHLLGENNYVGEKLIYDKSKGNHFEKIEEYIEKHKEEIFKGMLGETWENGINIRFYTLILHKLDDNKYVWYNDIHEIKDNILREVKNENFDSDLFYKERDLKEKEFFKTKIKYEDIDWGKYIEYMEDYPVLVMEIEYKVLHSEEENEMYKEDYHIYSSDFNILSSSSKLSEIGIRRINTRQKIYKDVEKFYNKVTFTFVIRDLSDPE
ncbi:hypothetical protein [Oceanivirga miroungae]|uniref:Uncharacterized protein n=1 Tax=Oceanivirga miroungae TaxID=1130046 RepID=A0A6I8MBB6_9FUSO|nr:hypothetical protein [Oceanivirga miroungae]VWL85536.1 hypothetical protein OMES3154_00822 [Oceanivirga miroungae]